MIERGHDRRRGQALFYEAISDRRRPDYDRRARAVVPVMPGVVRPGYGEVPPPRERRQRPEAGME
jgi:hypothetical protein